MADGNNVWREIVRYPTEDPFGVIPEVTTCFFFELADPTPDHLDRLCSLSYKRRPRPVTTRGRDRCNSARSEQQLVDGAVLISLEVSRGPMTMTSDHFPDSVSVWVGLMWVAFRIIVTGVVILHCNSFSRCRG